MAKGPLRGAWEVTLVAFTNSFDRYSTTIGVAHHVGDWAHDFEQMRTVVGGDYAMCVSLFPGLCTLNNAVYIFAYAYTFKAAYEWFRCHPGNDGKGIWCSRAAAAPAERDAEYTNL